MKEPRLKNLFNDKLHILSYFLQIEAHKVNYKANDENSLYMNVDFGLFNYMR